MKTFKLSIPYEQERSRIYRGDFKCEIEAETLEEAIQIFEVRSKDGYFEEFGTDIKAVDDEQQDDEITRYGEYEYDKNSIYVESVVEHEEEPKPGFLNCTIVTDQNGWSTGWINGERFVESQCDDRVFLPEHILRYVADLNSKGISVSGFEVKIFLMESWSILAIPDSVNNETSLKNWYYDSGGGTLRQVF
jgi:hypothetical protein